MSSNAVTRRERITTQAMSPTMSGSYVQVQYDCYAWRCDTCGLVWDKKHLAVNCASRTHVQSFEDGPYGVTYVLNGVPQGNIHYYTRTAMRREKVAVGDDLRFGILTNKPHLATDGASYLWRDPKPPLRRRPPLTWAFRRQQAGACHACAAVCASVILCS